MQDITTTEIAITTSDNDRHCALGKREYVGWIDILRVLACILVVFSHCSDGFTAQFLSNREAFLTGASLGSLVRPCVPLFVMMTGVLLLPLDTKCRLHDFYRKRIGRILPPLIFWCILLPILSYLYYIHINPTTANPLIDVESYTTTSLLHRATSFVFNFNFDSIPLWYLYMLIGLYLAMPIVNAWLEQATRKEIRTVLFIWGISLLLPYYRMAAPLLGYEGNYGHAGLLGECDWNPFGSLYYMSGFIGYVILAYYLTKYPLKWSNTKLFSIGIPMFIVGYAITFFGYVITNEYFPGDYAYLEIIWYFCGINVFMMTFPIFTFMQRIKGNGPQWLSRLASLTFGIYLCHYIFVFMTYDLYDHPTLPYVVRIMLMTLTSFVLATFLTWGLSRFKTTSRLIR